jgi:hypothetical protein
MAENSDAGYARGAQDRWIRDYAPGLSFADVGGLWGTVGEKVSVAYRAQCRSVAMVDVMAPKSEWWEKFFAHAEQKGVPRSAIGTRIANLERENFAELAGTYDYVNCSGVLYHVPNPLNVMRNLSLIAGKFLCVSTQIIPERLSNAAGTLDVPEGQALFVPSLTPAQKAVLRHFYDEQNYKVTHINRDGAPFYKDGKFNYGPSYWLPTRGMVAAWIRMFGLEVIESALISAHGAAFLARRT